MAGRRWRLSALFAACDKWQRFCRQVNLIGAAECPARGSELGTAQFHAFQPHASAAWRQGSAAPLILQALSFSSQAKRAGQTTSTAPRPARPPRPASPPRRLTKSGAAAGQPRSKAPSCAAQVARPASPKRPSGGRQGSAARAQPAQTPPLPPKPAPASQPVPTAPPPPIPAPPGSAGSSGSVALPRASQLTTKQAGGATPPASPAPPPGAVKGGSGEVGLDAGGERTPLGVALAGGQQGGGPAAGRASREVQGVGGQPPGPSTRLGLSSGPSGLPPPKQLPQAPAPPPPPSPSAWPPPTSLPKPARGDGSREGAPGQSLLPQPRDSSSSRGGGGGGGGLADAQLYAVVQGWAGQHARLPPSNPLELIALQADPLHAHPAARRHWVDTFASSVLPLHLPQLQPYLLHPAIGASAAQACLSRWWDSWWRASLPRLHPPLHLLTLSKAAQAGGGGVEGGRQGLYAAQLRSWQAARPDFRQLDALAMKGSSSPHHYSHLGLPPSLTQPLELRVWGTATQPGQPSPPAAATPSPQTSLQHQQLRQHQAPVAAAAAGGGGGEGAEARRRRCLLSSWARHPSTLGKLKARSIPDQVLSLTCSPLLTLPPAPSAAGPPPSPSTNFCAWLHAACSWPLLQQLAAYQLDERRNSPGSLLLSDLHLAWLAEHQAQAAASWAQQAALLNLRQPESWYPMARALRRRFIYHAGPTNSGKTYAAMQALAAAQRGVYCGPLRLLALEAYDKLNAAGVRCSLMTGEEVRHLPQASHQACTVEMAPVVTGLDCPALKHLPLESMASHASHLHALLSHMEPGWKLPANATSYSSGLEQEEQERQPFVRLQRGPWAPLSPPAAPQGGAGLTAAGAPDTWQLQAEQAGGGPGGGERSLPQASRLDVAVLDEIQMLGDTDRGWAWTRAVLGLPANEIHVCGDDSALQLMKRLCAAMGEPLEVRHTQRFSPLVVQEGGVPGRLTGMQPGDALVAFSRADIFNYKIALEVLGFRVCVVYGALPAETRAAQARLFNDPNSGYDILVASDAIGMGLNLNVRRVVLSTVYKRDTTPGRYGFVLMSDSQIRQIAGRAGRRGTLHSEGYATCLEPSHVPLLQAALQRPLAPLQAAGLMPEEEQVVALSALSPPGTPLGEILRRFDDAAQVDGQRYRLCDMEEPAYLADLTQEFPELSLEQRLVVSKAPLKVPAVQQQRAAGAQHPPPGPRHGPHQGGHQGGHQRSSTPLAARKSSLVIDNYMRNYLACMTSEENLTLPPTPPGLPPLVPAPALTRLSPGPTLGGETEPAAASWRGYKLPGQSGLASGQGAWIWGEEAEQPPPSRCHWPRFPLAWLAPDTAPPWGGGPGAVKEQGAALHPLPSAYDRLLLLEVYHQALSVWLWLSNRLPAEMFPGKSGAQHHMTELVATLNASVEETTTGFVTSALQLSSSARQPPPATQPNTAPVPHATSEAKKAQGAKEVKDEAGAKTGGQAASDRSTAQLKIQHELASKDLKRRLEAATSPLIPAQYFSS